MFLVSSSFAPNSGIFKDLSISLAQHQHICIRRLHLLNHVQWKLTLYDVVVLLLYVHGKQL